MTTIATDGRSMAGDGLATLNHAIVSQNHVKVVRLSDGSLFGATGDTGQIKRVAAWLEDGADPGAYPHDLKEAVVLVLRPDGKIYTLDELSAGYLDPIEAPAAIGAGERYAMGAMDAGASPEEAIRITSRRDPYTNDRVTVLHLFTTKKENE
jgi:ATP-dependent protease HslVU (ClpYQ) peptidase subunit